MTHPPDASPLTDALLTAPGGSAPRPARERLERAARLLPAAVGLLLLAAYVRVPQVAGDTLVLLSEVHHTAARIAAGSIGDWGGQFGLLQTVPVLALLRLGISDARILRALALLSVAAFIGLFVLGWFGLASRSRLLAFLFAGLLAGGPLPWYAGSTFGESLATFLTLAFVMSCLGSGEALLVALLVIAGTTKDTAVPFLLLFGVAASFASPERWRDPAFRRRRLLVLAAGAVAAAAVNVLFDYSRFGLPYNSYYLQPFLIVPQLGIQASFLAAIWLSPNGGILPFWPLLGLLLVASAVVLGQRLARERSAAAVIPGLFVFAALAGLSIGFARWFSPLGWVAWGPRLMLPWLPAAVFILMLAHRDELEAMIRRTAGSRWAATVAGVALAAVTLPQFMVLFRPGLVTWIFTADPACPRIAHIETDAGYYYGCINHLLWTKGSVLLPAYQPSAGLVPFLLGLLATASLAAFLVLGLRADAGTARGAGRP